MHGKDDLLTLGEACKITPGRPSTNCVWRWCRQGVLSRNGQRTHLQHVRLGGRIYTTARWLDEFGERLAAADGEHFNVDDALPPPPRKRRATRRRRYEAHRRAAIEHAVNELEGAGL